MIDILESDADFVLALAINGRITQEDIAPIVDTVENRLTRHERLRVCVELRDLGGVSIRSMFDDLKRALKHWRRFEALVLITDTRWLVKGGPMVNRFFPGLKLRTFPFSARVDAYEWIKD